MHSSPQHYMMMSSTDVSYNYDTLSNLFSHEYFGIPYLTNPFQSLKYRIFGQNF
jgi:hypothetical protein